MELGGMGMGMGVGVGIGVGSSPPPSTTSTANPKKKRRTNANNTQASQRAPTIQDYVPPPLSGFGDTVVASNPFDDTPPAGMNTGMHNGPQQMLPHHPHHMGNPQLRGMNPMASSNMNPMMPHMGGVNPINNPGMGNHMGHMGNMPNANLPPVNSMNPMNNMRSNMPQGNMPPMNSHMGMNHMMNSPMNGPPTLNSPMNGMNHNLGSPMGGPIGSPINNMSPNHMASSTMSVSGINPANAGLPHSGPPPHPNHMNNIRMNRPHNMPMTAMASAVPNPMLGNNQMNNLNMIRSQMNNMQNVNVNQRNQMGHMGNPMGNVPNNMSGKSPSHGMNIGNAMPQHGLQGPPLGPKPIPESTGKVYPPDQPMVFNHQNPNAPPISPCGVCHKEVHANDQAILCESGCNFWFHRRCTGLNEMAFELLMNEVCAEWACDRCMSSKNVSLVKFKP